MPRPNSPTATNNKPWLTRDPSLSCICYSFNFRNNSLLCLHGQRAKVGAHVVAHAETTASPERCPSPDPRHRSSAAAEPRESRVGSRPPAHPTQTSPKSCPVHANHRTELLAGLRGVYGSCDSPSASSSCQSASTAALSYEPALVEPLSR